MKKEYDLKKLRKRRGKVKIDPGAAQVPVSIRLGAGKSSTTVRLDREDTEALERARADGHASSDLIRKGLRVVAAKYYRGRRSPSTQLFASDSAKMGDESELFEDPED